MAEVDLGFPEQREDAALWLCNRYFPSKVGGKPAWLELESLPTKEVLQCGNCADPMSFLCQIYAPGEDEHNFHRSLFVFICREPGCQKPNDASNLRVLRSQLPLKNDFYSEIPPAEEGDPEPEIPAKIKTCLVCGCPGPLKCGRCRKANYCSAKHQRAAWPTHKKYCCSQNDNENESIPAEIVEKIVFPECEIVIEPNSNSDDMATGSNKLDDTEREEQQRLRDFEKLDAEGKTGTFKDLPEAELEKYAQGDDDKHFRRFKKEISNEPDQIIRYKRSGTPLWITDIEKSVAPILQDLPDCELCGSGREFEFQIMPQMLLLLKDENIDWGVIAVYTCPNNCAIHGYTKEFIVKQDIEADKK